MNCFLLSYVPAGPKTDHSTAYFLYIIVTFPQTICERHPIAHPRGQGMVCLSWFPCFNKLYTLWFLQYCVIMDHEVYMYAYMETVVFIYWSGHEGAAVSLPGFAMIAKPGNETAAPSWLDLLYILFLVCMSSICYTCIWGLGYLYNKIKKWNMFVHTSLYIQCAAIRMQTL